MGIVFKAHDRLLDETVAIKFLNEGVAVTSAITQRFRAEIRLARRVTHRGVCRIHEYGEDEGLRYISMAFVDGVDLKRQIQEKGPPAADEALEMAIAAAEALQAIHDEGIIHRDLKTSNIMVDRKGVLRLMDFGLAKEWTTEPGTTMSGQLIGTPHYMSPEQAQGLKADFRSDIYSAGVVIFELFTGAPPFEARTPLALLRKHVEEAPPLDGPQGAAIPRAVASVLLKALAKDAEQRFSTAAELAAALKLARYARDSVDPGQLARLREAHTVHESTDASKEAAFGAARVPPARPRGGPRTRWLPWLTAALGILAAVSMGLAWHAYRQAPSQELAPSPTEPELPSPSPAATAAEDIDSARKEPERAPPSGTAVKPTPRPAAPMGPRRASPPPAPTPNPTAASAASSPEPAPALASPRAAVPPTPPPSEPSAAPATGVLQILVIPPSEILIDGTTIGSVASKEVTLSPGTHVIRILHPDYQPLQRMVAVRSGELSRLVLDLAEKGIRRR